MLVYSTSGLSAPIVGIVGTMVYGYATADGKVIDSGGKAPVAILKTVQLGSKTVIKNRLSPGVRSS